MKKFFLYLTIACSIFATAQTSSKYSPSAQLLVNKTNKIPQRIKGKAQSYIPVTIETSDADVLEEHGIIVGSQIGDYVTAMVPLSQYSQLGNIEEIKYIDAGNYSHTLLDNALPNIGYNQILETPYTSRYMGKGVIVGIVDIGFQWDHMAFRNADGSSRILAAWNQNDTTGTAPEPYEYGTLYDTEEELYTATLCDTETHGTHVASIAAGSAIGDIPYGGVAREASLVLVEAMHNKQGGIYDEGIIDGINYIFDYAKKANMPCVINLSLGNSMGPHDGTSSFDIMCDSLQGEGRLIVGSIGNSGQQYYHLGYDFDTQDSVFHAGLKNQSYSLPFIDIWSEKPLKIDLELYHGHTDTILNHTGWLPIDTFYENSLSYFDREILVEVESEKYPKNNLYNTYIATSGVKSLGNTYFALKVQGDGGKVNIWVNSPGTQFSSRGREGWLGGDTQMTLNETGGTGKRITSVGAYTTDTLKETRTTFDVDYEMYAITPFSSRGLTPDGRIKPDIVAPGSLITAGFNKRLAADPQNYFYNNVMDTFVFEDSTYYYGVNSGTSMAAPIVTGTYALWLQANPRLTPEEAKEILIQTAIQDEYTTDPAAAGYGKINPYAGLVLLLEKAGTTKLQNESPAALYPTIGNGLFNIVCTEQSPLQVEIYNTEGRLITTRQIDNPTHQAPIQINIDNNTSGVYLIKITTTTSSKTYKYVLL